MILLRLCRNILLRLLVVLVIISSLVAPPAFCQETEDSQVFIAGFNAYQQKDYASSIDKMSEVLQKYPDTPLRDMAMFWLARSYYKAGNQQEAARYLSRFSKEFPDNPLKSTVEEDLLALTERYDKGEKLSSGLPPVNKSDLQAARKAEAEKERLEAAKAEVAKRTAAASAEASLVRALKQSEEKAGAEKKEQEQTAAVKAEQERIAKENAANREAEQQRMAASKAAEALRVEAAVENARIAAKKAETDQLAQQNIAVENAVVKSEYREKAIRQFKDIINKYPTSAAAVTASAKLRELGVTVALPPQSTGEPLPENSQVLRLEVAQFAGFEFSLLPHPTAVAVGRHTAIPFEITNRGNGNDSFNLESSFPTDFNARFASVAAPDVAIAQTPELAPGAAFKGIIDLVIPPGTIDGLRITHPVKAVSRLIAEASQTREVGVTASAPLLRAVLRTEKSRPLPGEKVVYRISILNVGSSTAQHISLRLNFPLQLEAIDPIGAGFKQESESALLLDGLQIASGESREFNAAFQLKDDALAGQELSTRAELINTPLKTSATFVSNIAVVEPQRSISVRAESGRIVAIPGQTISVPFVVTNTGNLREKFKISAVVTGANDAVIFHDVNRDGIHQAGEPVISEVGPLAPREEACVIVEIKTPAAAADNSTGNVQASFISEGDTSRSASASTQLNYSRPVVKMVMTGHDGRLKPGDVASFDLTISNSGSNFAKVVELQSVWPEQLELLAAHPAATAVNSGAVAWRFKEMGAGEKRNIKVSFRVKPGSGVGTAIQVKNILTYEDQQGNRY